MRVWSAVGKHSGAFDRSVSFFVSRPDLPVGLPSISVVIAPTSVPVSGPDHAADLPVAVSNPIFVDVDGHGFKPNGDLMGKVPVKGARP